MLCVQTRHSRRSCYNTRSSFSTSRRRTRAFTPVAFLTPPPSTSEQPPPLLSPLYNAPTLPHPLSSRVKCCPQITTPGVVCFKHECHHHSATPPPSPPPTLRVRLTVCKDPLPQCLGIAVSRAALCHVLYCVTCCTVSRALPGDLGCPHREMREKCCGGRLLTVLWWRCYLTLSTSHLCHVCRSNNYSDEVSWSAGWLFKATNQNKYLEIAKKGYLPGPAWGFSWDEKLAGNMVSSRLSGWPDAPSHCYPHLS